MPRTATLVVVAIVTVACGDDGPSAQPAAAEPTTPRTVAPEGKPDAPAPQALPPAADSKPAPEAIKIGHVDTRDALVLEHLYWMPPQYMLGRKPSVAVTGTVRELAKLKPRRPSLQGGPTFVFEARVEIDKVLHGALESPFVVVELADGLQVGDKLVVYAHEHEGKLGLIEAKDSNCRVGIEVAAWTDPIVARLPAALDGSADLSDATTADAWRAFGEPAIQCWLDGRAVAKCD